MNNIIKKQNSMNDLIKKILEIKMKLKKKIISKKLNHLQLMMKIKVMMI